MSAIRAIFMVTALVGVVARGVEAQTTTTTTLPTSYLKCYKAKDPLTVRGSGPGWLELDSQGPGQEHCRVLGGFRLVCVPASAQITTAIEGRIGAGPFAPITPITLPTEEALSQDRLCYKIKCVEPPAINADRDFIDQFGTRKLSRFKAYLVCGPAVTSLCGDGNLDFGEECDDGNRTNGDCCNANCRAEPNGQVCGPDSDSNECTQPRCDGAGACAQSGFLEPTTTLCTDTDSNTCTKAHCDGVGACSQTGFLEPVTTVCPDTDANPCTKARCNGGGGCAQNGFLEPITTVCTDTDGNDCTRARCTSGVCSQVAIVEANGTACADTDGNPCSFAQCTSGACNQSVPVPVGTECPDIDGNQCNRAGCDELGVCAQDFFIRNCTLPETCEPSTGICE